MLKVDLHLHSNEDPVDSFIQHSAKDLIRHCAKLKFDVIALTLHQKVHYPRDLVDFAKSKGVLMLKGCEAVIEGKDVLIYGLDDDQRNKIKTFDDLRKIKDQVLTIAPHPYYVIGGSLMGDLKKNIDLFDAIEFCHFYCRAFNLNRFARKTAAEFGKPLFANSDAHSLNGIGWNYSLVDSDKNEDSVFEAIKKGNIEIKSKPYSTWGFGLKAAKILSGKPIEIIKSLF
jgi:predicted metal-dependent phosphoesterase TrpH